VCGGWLGLEIERWAGGTRVLVAYTATEEIKDKKFLCVKNMMKREKRENDIK